MLDPSITPIMTDDRRNYYVTRIGLLDLGRVNGKKKEQKRVDFSTYYRFGSGFVRIGKALCQVKANTCYFVDKPKPSIISR